MSSRNAVALHLLGSPAFETLNAEGGRCAGIRTICSDALSSNIILVDTARTAIADEGQLNLSIARHASLQMQSAPTNASGTAAATNMVSLWQTGSVGILVERTLNDAVLDGAVQFIEDALFGFLSGSPSGSPA
ncbi:MAG: hypothetical protein ABW318_27510 [Vicinamibacterales bacterium]